MAVAVAGEEAKIVADEMAAQPEDGPARARRRSVPVRRVQAGQQLAQPGPLDQEQAGKVPRRLGRGPLWPLSACCRVISG
jgi:hypothetical protein